MTAAITLHFRKPELTRECVDSLLLDGWAPILIWDNSDDGGVSAEPLRDRYAGEPRVRIVRSPANLGYGKGMNAAMAELGLQGYAGPILLVNNDAKVMQGMRVALEAQLPDDDSTAMIAPRLMQDGCEQGWLHYQPWLAMVSKRPLPGSFPYLSGCCLLVRRMDNARPLFDEDFFMYGEDVELSWRLRRDGGHLVLLDRSYLQHEGSSATGQASEAYERYLVRSHMLLADKLALNPGARVIMHMLRIPSLFARACLRAWRFRSMMPLRVLVSKKTASHSAA